MIPVLFLGGCVDGEVHETNLDSIMVMNVVQGDYRTFSSYRREKVAVGHTNFWVYLEKDLTPTEALVKLTGTKQ